MIFDTSFTQYSFGSIQKFFFPTEHLKSQTDPAKQKIPNRTLPLCFLIIEIETVEKVKEKLSRSPPTQTPPSYGILCQSG